MTMVTKQILIQIIFYQAITTHYDKSEIEYTLGCYLALPEVTSYIVSRKCNLMKPVRPLEA